MSHSIAPSFSLGVEHRQKPFKLCFVIHLANIDNDKTKVLKIVAKLGQSIKRGSVAH